MEGRLSSDPRVVSALRGETRRGSSERQYWTWYVVDIQRES